MKGLKKTIWEFWDVWILIFFKFWYFENCEHFLKKKSKSEIFWKMLRKKIDHFLNSKKDVFSSSKNDRFFCLSIFQKISDFDFFLQKKFTIFKKFPAKKISNYFFENLFSIFFHDFFLKWSPGSKAVSCWFSAVSDHYFEFCTWVKVKCYFLARYRLILIHFPGNGPLTQGYDLFKFVVQSRFEHFSQIWWK